MRIAVLGTGVVGRTLSGGFVACGHQVVMGSRDPAAALARSSGEADGLAAWSQEHPEVELATFANAVPGADVVVNATSGDVSLAVLVEVGAERLADRIVIDVANPLDFSQGFPPLLFVKDIDSLGEVLQRAFPNARVVKALNTMTAALMVDPGSVGGGDHSAFVCGDDDAAKQVVIGLLRDLGHRDVIDLGGISASRGTEMYLALWTRLMPVLGTAMFNLKIVR